MSIFAVIVVASLAGAAILMIPSLMTFCIVDSVASAIIVVVDALSGASFGFIIESVVVFILCSTFVFFVLAIGGAMIAYGRISNPRTNDESPHDSRLSITRLLSAGMLGLITRS